MIKRLVHSGLALWMSAVCTGSVAQTAASGADSDTGDSDVDLDTVTLIMPIQISRQALSSGCWVQLFDQIGFKGRALTILGPSEFKALAKAIGMQSKQTEPNSLVMGPKAGLTVYEAPNFQGTFVQFQAAIREPELHKKLGFAGRVESMKIDCPK